MTLEEAIRHCKDMARLNEAECFECAEEHRQLAEWLQELKERRKNDKQGKWIVQRNKQGVHIYSVCSNCNVPYLDTDFPNFCPNCGARMKGGDEK